MPRLTSQLPRQVPRLAFLALTLAGSLLITATSLGYFDLDRLPPFVIEKLPVRFERLWLSALRVQVAAASVSLPLCVLLCTRWLQRRLAWHRRIGRVAGMVVGLALVPSGAILALEAKGGRIGAAGFLLSGAIVLGALVHGVLAARRHEGAAHARAMRHVIAQMSVAVSSRAMLLGLDSLGVDPDAAYRVALWIPVLASAAVVELTSPGPSLLRRLVPIALEGVRRAPLALPVLDRARPAAPALLTRRGR